MEPTAFQLTADEREALDTIQALRPVLSRIQQARGTENLPETFALWQMVTDLERYLVAEAGFRALGMVLSDPDNAESAPAARVGGEGAGVPRIGSRNRN